MNQHDIRIIRDLARQYMEMATSDAQARMNRRMKDTNDLKLTRPPVLIDEVPWHELNGDGELSCVCKEEGLRWIEHFFRTALYRRRHRKVDTLFEPFWRVRMAYDSTELGIAKSECVLRTDEYNSIMSHKYTDILEDEAAPDRLQTPHSPFVPIGTRQI